MHKILYKLNTPYWHPVNNSLTLQLKWRYCAKRAYPQVPHHWIGSGAKIAAYLSFLFILSHHIVRHGPKVTSGESAT